MELEFCRQPTCQLLSVFRATWFVEPSAQGAGLTNSYVDTKQILPTVFPIPSLAINRLLLTFTNLGL